MGGETVEPDSDIKALEYHPNQDAIAISYSDKNAEADETTAITLDVPDVQELKVDALAEREPLISSDKESLLSSASEIIRPATKADWVEPASRPEGLTETHLKKSVVQNKRIPKAKRAREQSVALAADEQQLSPLEQKESISIAPKSFLDEMMDLDGEIGELRKRLAGKLFEQNIQLKQMLKRFEQP